MSKLLALDQSSRVTGWAVFDGDKLQEYGKFEFDSSIPIGTRLHLIKKQVNGLISKYQIEELVLEDIQFQTNVVNNVQTFKTLAEVFGVIIELCEELKLPWSAVLASSWKHTLGIKGSNRAAQKKNAQDFIVNTYGVKPIQDICDAICIGIHQKKVNTNDGFDWS